MVSICSQWAEQQGALEPPAACAASSLRGAQSVSGDLASPEGSVRKEAVGS